MPLVGDRDLDATPARARARRRRSAVRSRAVGDGVGQQVGQRGHQLALDAAHDEAALRRRRRSRCPWRGPRCGCGRRPRRRPRRRPPARGSGSGSAPCSRDRSISSRDQPAEPVGLVRDPAGEPAHGLAGRRPASSIASASSDSAPTGVFSSWPTLATKSRRTASSRRASVTSCEHQRDGPGAADGAGSEPHAVHADQPGRRSRPARPAARRRPGGGAARGTWRGPAVSSSGTGTPACRGRCRARGPAGLASTTASSASSTTTAGSMRSSSRGRATVVRDRPAGRGRRRRAAPGRRGRAQARRRQDAHQEAEHAAASELTPNR